MAHDSLSVNAQPNGNGQRDSSRTQLTWSAAELEALVEADHVWFVQVTDGHGNAIHRSSRREVPATASAAIDAVVHAIARCGAHLNVGDIGVSAQIFSGGLLVTTRIQNAAVVSALASPQANLGQMLNHMRRITATFKVGDSGR